MIQTTENTTIGRNNEAKIELVHLVSIFILRLKTVYYNNFLFKVTLAAISSGPIQINNYVTIISGSWTTWRHNRDVRFGPVPRRPKNESHGSKKRPDTLIFHSS